MKLQGLETLQFQRCRRTVSGASRCLLREDPSTLGTPLGIGLSHLRTGQLEVAAPEEAVAVRGYANSPTRRVLCHSTELLLRAHSTLAIRMRDGSLVLRSASTGALGWLGESLAT